VLCGCLQVEVAWAIGVLAAHPELEVALAEAGAIEALIKLQQAKREDVRKRADWSMRILSNEALTYNDILSTTRRRAEGPQEPAKGTKEVAGFPRLPVAAPAAGGETPMMAALGPDEDEPEASDSEEWSDAMDSGSIPSGDDQDTTNTTAQDTKERPAAGTVLEAPSEQLHEPPPAMSDRVLSSSAARRGSTVVASRPLPRPPSTTSPRFEGCSGWPRFVNNVVDINVNREGRTLSKRYHR